MWDGDKDFHSIKQGFTQRAQWTQRFFRKNTVGFCFHFSSPSRAWRPLRETIPIALHIQVIDNPLDVAFQHFSPEVDEQAKLEIGQPQIGEHLFAMHSG